MPTKFYLHDATTGVGGTLPGATAVAAPIFAGGITTTAANAATNRTMNDTIGAGQTSIGVTTVNTTNQQTSWFRRFISPPLAAQTISSQPVSASIGASESAAQSDMFESGAITIALWRPGTGAVVNNSNGDAASFVFNNVGTTALNEPGTSQTVCTITPGANNTIGWTVQAGDVLVCEVFSRQNQSMATAYTNTVFYDGTTEGSTTNIAAYIEFTNDVALFVDFMPRFGFVDHANPGVF